MFSDYAAVQDYLHQLGLESHRFKYGIERMTRLADALGQPQKQYPVIHVAGTNGKGSTCAMLEAVYRRAGYRTGLYTSPHLVFLGERIRVKGRMLTPEQVTAYTETIKTVSEQVAKDNPDDFPTFFEFMTAMAFLHFQREAVDIAIIETGLGGRLDATNIIDPELTIITSIGLDHTQILGDTLGKIAAEKAGIIKPGKPVICGILPEEAEIEIKNIVKQKSCILHRLAAIFGTDEAHYPQTNLAGRYQRRNAAAATLAVQLLEKIFPVSKADRENALQIVDWPGRWQTYSLAEGKELIIDTSHNAEGFVGLVENLEALITRTGRKPIIIAAATGEDRAHALMSSLADYADILYLVQPKQERACSPEILQAALPKNFTGQTDQARIAELFPEPGVCTLGESGTTIVATGSIYLAGEVIEALSPNMLSGEHHLQDRP